MRGTKRIVFDNGLILLMEKRAYARETAILIGTKSGSVNEENPGITHFLEHMLFETNKWRTYQEIVDELEATGADINAQADQVLMFFYAKTLPSETAKVFQIIFEAVTNDEYKKDEFLKEKDEILSEIKTYIEHPLDYLYDSLFLPALFKGTPLERAIIGTVGSVNRITPKKLIDYKKEILTPNRPMAVVVTGEFDENNLIKEVSETFGRLPAGTPSPDLKINLENKKARKLKHGKGVQQVYLALGFRTPGLSHKDTFKLQLIEEILAGGLSTRLFREIRNKRGIGYIVGSRSESFGEVGSLCFFVNILRPERTEEAEDVIVSELRDLKTNLVSSKELEKAKNLIVRKYYDIMERIENRAFRIMVKEFQGIPCEFNDFEHRIRQLTAEDILIAARKYLSEEYTLAILVPEGFKV